MTLDKLTNAQIRDGNGGAILDGLTAQQRDALVTNTPLWFYILREAELNQGKLKGCRRSDRRRDVPSGDGGQPDVDRP